MTRFDNFSENNIYQCGFYTVWEHNSKRITIFLVKNNYNYTTRMTTSINAKLDKSTHLIKNILFRNYSSQNELNTGFLIWLYLHFKIWSSLIILYPIVLRIKTRKVKCNTKCNFKKLKNHYRKFEIDATRYSLRLDVRTNLFYLKKNFVFNENETFKNRIVIHIEILNFIVLNSFIYLLIRIYN